MNINTGPFYSSLLQTQLCSGQFTTDLNFCLLDHESHLNPHPGGCQRDYYLTDSVRVICLRDARHHEQQRRRQWR